MARGKRKTIEEKIAEKEEIIECLQIRINKETNELKALLREKNQKEIETLHDFIKKSNLNLYEATEVLQEYMSHKYKATA